MKKACSGKTYSRQGGALLSKRCLPDEARALGFLSRSQAVNTALSGPQALGVRKLGIQDTQLKEAALRKLWGNSGERFEGLPASAIVARGELSKAPEDPQLQEPPCGIDEKDAQSFLPCQIRSNSIENHG